MDFQETVDYQNKCKSNVRITVVRAHNSNEWEALIATEHNEWPHWQIARGSTPETAWAQLKAFLDGGPQIHGNAQISGPDFFIQGG